jgi:hypothetical protein
MGVLPGPGSAALNGHDAGAPASAHAAPPSRALIAAYEMAHMVRRLSMPVFMRYASEAAAREAVEAWWHGGMPDDDIWLRTGSRLRDIRREPVGGFAGAIGPCALVGTYGNVGLLRRQGAGGFAGDPDRQRQGSFADSVRMVITTARDGARRSRVAGYLKVRWRYPSRLCARSLNRKRSRSFDAGGRWSTAAIRIRLSRTAPGRRSGGEGANHV